MTLERALEIADALLAQDRAKLHAYCVQGWSGNVHEIIGFLAATIRASARAP